MPAVSCPVCSTEYDSPDGPNGNRPACPRCALTPPEPPPPEMSAPEASPTGERPAGPLQEAPSELPPVDAVVLEEIPPEPEPLPLPDPDPEPAPRREAHKPPNPFATDAVATRRPPRRSAVVELQLFRALIFPVAVQVLFWTGSLCAVGQGL